MWKNIDIQYGIIRQFDFVLEPWKKLAKNFKNLKVVSHKNYERVSNAMWKCLQQTNMVK